MNKKKAIKMTLIMIAIFSIICTIVLPGYVKALSPNEIKGNTSVKGATEIKTLGSNIVGILQTAGIVISVVILLVLGIKYMVGSEEEKAEYKKSMIPYLVGALIIFGASTIANVVYQFAINLQK